MRIELSPWQSTETTIRVANTAAAAGITLNNPKTRRRKREKSPTPNGGHTAAGAAAHDDADSDRGGAGSAEDSSSIVVGGSMMMATSFVHLTSKGNARRARHKKHAAAAAAAAAGSASASNNASFYAPEDVTHPPCLVITAEHCISVVGRHENKNGNGIGSLKESTGRKYNCRPGMRFLPSNNNNNNNGSLSSSNNNAVVNQQQLALISAVLDEKHERLYAFQRENHRLVSWSTLDGDSSPQKDDLILKHTFDEPATSLDLVELATPAGVAVVSATLSTTRVAAVHQQQQQQKQQQHPTRVFCYGSLQDSKRLFVATTSTVTTTVTTTNAVATGKPEHSLHVQTFDIPSKENHDELRIVGTVVVAAATDQVTSSAALAGSKRNSTAMTSSNSSTTDNRCYFYQVLMAKDRILLVRHTITAASCESSLVTADQKSSRGSNPSTGVANLTATTTNYTLERVHVQAASIVLPPSMQRLHVMAETARFVGLVQSDNGSGTAILTFQAAEMPQQRQRAEQPRQEVYMISISLRTAEIVAGPFAISGGSRNGSCLLMGASRGGDASQQAIIVAVPFHLGNEILLYDAMRGALIQRIEVPSNSTDGNDEASRWSLAVDSRRSLLAILHEQNGKVYLSVKAIMATSRTRKILSLADGLAAAALSYSCTTRSLTSIPSTTALVVGDLMTILENEVNADDRGGGGKRKKMKLISAPGQRASIAQSLLMLKKARDEILDSATKPTAGARLKAGYLCDVFEAAITMASADEVSSSTHSNEFVIEPEKEQNQDIIVVSANPQDDRSPLHDAASSKLKSLPGSLMNGMKSHFATYAVNGHRTPILVPTNEETAPPDGAPAPATTTTTANPVAVSGAKRRNITKTLNSLPAGFVNGAAALMIQILTLPRDDPTNSERRALHDEARLMLGRLLRTRKTSARALFQACSKSYDSKKSLLKFLQSLAYKKDEDAADACYSTMDFALDLLQYCVDLSERHMILLINYMLTTARPEDVAGCFLRNKTRSDVVKNASYISSIAMSDRYIKLQERLKSKKTDSSGTVGGKDSLEEKNDCDAKDAQEMDKLSNKLILAGTDTLLDAILSYSDCNETLIRGALTEFIPRSGRLMLAKMLWEKRSQPRKMTLAGNSSHVTKSNRLVVLLSALCDTLQHHGESCSASELAFFKCMQVELDREVHGADALLRLQQTLNETVMRIQQSSSVGADTSGPTKQQLHPYQLERLIF